MSRVRIVDLPQADEVLGSELTVLVQDGITKKAATSQLLELAEANYPVRSVSGKVGNVTLDRGDVGLSQVDNTSDVDKPVSTAQQTALNGKMSKTGPETITANSASAALTITQTGAGHALVVEDATSPDSTPFVIDANGVVITGRTSAIASLGVIPKIQALGTSHADNAFGTYAYNSDVGSGGNIHLGKSKSDTVGAHGAVSSGDTFGTLRFVGSDGANFIQGASIVASVDGTPGTNDMPGRLVFSTTPDGSATPVERMRITSTGDTGVGLSAPQARLEAFSSSTTDAVVGGVRSAGPASGIKWTYFTVRADTAASVSQGYGGALGGYLDQGVGGGIGLFTLSGAGLVERLRIASSGNVGIGMTPTSRNNTRLQIVDGIGFPATQVASSDPNTLDDYEEGTFTPTIVGTTAAGVGTYTAQVGRYQKVGNRVTISIDIGWTAHTGTGGMRVSGLPFAVAQAVSFAMWYSDIVLSVDHHMESRTSSTSSGQIVLYQVPVGGATGAFFVPIDTAGQLTLSGTYEV